MQGKALPGRGLILLLATLPVTLIAAPGDPSLLPKAEEQFQHQQQQQKAREARLAAEAPDIRIPVATASSSHL